MNCAKTHGLISLNLDGELSPREQAALAAHLCGCRACRVAEAGLRRQLLAGLPRLAAPAGFSARVMGNLAPVPARGLWWLRLLAGVAEVAVLSAIILTGMLSGADLAARLSPEKTVAATLALDLFDPAPPDSLGGVYLTMTEVRDEK